MSDEAVRIPPAARERLGAVRDRKGGFFTSDLSVQEFLLVKEAGFRPLTQVMGSCFYHLGYQAAPAAAQGFGQYLGAGGAFAWQTGAYRQGQTFELETLTEGWNEARRLALGRIAEEAALAGADAVVGVRLERGAYDWSMGLIEFVVTGTAVVSQRYELDTAGGPVLSNLSGQEFGKLYRHGWLPLGLVAGSTVSYAMTGWAQMSRVGQGIFASWQNQELPDFTRAMYDARTQAMLRVTREAHELGAHGLVGVRMDHEEVEHEQDRGGTRYTDLVVTMHVLGTAIVELAEHDEPPVYIALPLDRERR